VNLKLLTDDQLTSQMDRLARSERKITHLVLLHINEIEDRGIHLDRGFDGMYSYLTKGLGYSDGSAYRRLQSARLLKQVPSIATQIEDGRLNLSQLTQVQKSLGRHAEPARALEILNKLENKNSFETQKTLAIEMNTPVQMREHLKPQKDESVRIEVTLSAEQFADLQMAKNLLSHVCPDGKLADIIGILARKFNQKKLALSIGY
jgi:hypothetical protein